MSEIQRIEKQLKHTFEGPAWHGSSVLELLSDVTATQAAARPLAGAHSMWELVLHIAAWQTAVRGGLEGEIPDLSDEEDWPSVSDTSQAAWSRAVDTLKESYGGLREAISRLTDSELEEIVEGKNFSLYFMLHGVIQHNLYHAGQIALLRKACQ